MADQAEGEEPRPRTRGGGGGSIFTRKLMGIPVWVLMAAVLGVLLAVTSLRSNKAKTTGTGSTASTAGTAALGTMASQTPPFVIQNYPNSPNVPAAAPSTTGGQLPPTPASPTGPQVISVGHNRSVTDIVNWAKANGFPNFSYSDFWALNPNITGLQIINGDWALTGWGTPVTLAKPGFISAGGATNSISNDASK